VPDDPYAPGQPPPPQQGPGGTYGPPPGQQPYGGYQPQYGYPPQSRGTNGFAIASLVCAFFCSPLGLIFGFIARGQIRRTGEGGDGLALAGIIVSAASIALAVISFIALAASSPANY